MSTIVNVRSIFPGTAICLLLVAPAWSQYHPIRFEHITTKDGLTQDIVTAIVQDSKGFMWFGTEDGLNRYDGYSVRVYKSNPSDSTTLAWNSINAMLVDRRGRLWVSAIGVNLYDERTDRFTRFRNSPADPFSLPYNHVPAFCQDSDGVIWAATDKGLAKFDERTGHWLRYVHDPSDPNSLSTDLVLSLLTDRSGTIWVGTRDGLNRFDPATGRCKRFFSTGHPTGEGVITPSWQSLSTMIECSGSEQTAVG